MHLLSAQLGGFVEQEGIVDLDQQPAPIVIMAAAESSLAMLKKAVSSLHEQLDRLSLQDGNSSVKKSSSNKHSAQTSASIAYPASQRPAIRLVNWTYLQKPAAYDLYEDKVLEQAHLVIVSMLGGASYWPYGFERLQAWQAAKPNRHLLLVPGDDTPDEQLQAASSADEASYLRVWAYLRNSGLANGISLISYSCQHLLPKSCALKDIPWHEPIFLPQAQLYRPDYLSEDSLAKDSLAKDSLAKDSLAKDSLAKDSLAKNSLVKDSLVKDSLVKDSPKADLATWQQHYQNDATRSQPNVVVLFYRSYWQSGHTAMLDGFLKTLEQAGLNPLAVAVSSLKEPLALDLVNHLVDESNASLIISALGFANNQVEAPNLSSQPTQFKHVIKAEIPILQVVLSSTSYESWQEAKQGLRSRDMAMQVVLPEMDGHILTRAISYQSLEAKDRLTQIGLARPTLAPDRAAFVAQLAKAYCRLSSRPNKLKRIAIMLANYPTKDGRIGNGVGLDTPASVINILHALKQQGYAVQDIPATGTQLINKLLQGITNNPNSLHYLPCWQSLSVSDYETYFAQLPTEVQTQVWQRWGAPKDDPKYRIAPHEEDQTPPIPNQGRLMIAGLRLGQTFVGIQPARGYNIDLLANYHDPDLVPPHSYLAFYFWLRHQYQVDAIMHVGKHGNAEWLPGKGVALSNQCYPEVILGPIPHFYPFIVNDPGEGAQAKRRTQAAIIDHLMPPMARAELYGAMQALEALVDELYQASGLDSDRENWLRQQILTLLSHSHVAQELGIEDTAILKASPDQPATQEAQADLLAKVDTYLCDIKESQIRHGLHTLGRLPEPAKLAETLVALLRLPRGTKAHEQGILHNLSHDLGLTYQDQDYDPLSQDYYVWQGIKPSLLQSQSDKPWVSNQDTRERLELLALFLVTTYVLQIPEIVPVAHAPTAKGLPATFAQLNYAKKILMAALDTSAEQEIAALMAGLNGQRIDPGPSGAPTRGRLDTLPTGRNFFSLDNRSIPSPAAWALGQLAAQSLLDRHLQEQGDYPRQLGISVWGTATMRTGGDDIAQAFALMGVKPIWAMGSQRVVDFEIIPAMQLGRPRVDVTLRVSGFFRDAFANVIKLYDAAVQALIDYEDPGGSNNIRNHILARQQALVNEGVDPSQALTQAAYRVYGSKPGAYGAGLQGLIDERCWQDSSDLAEAYVNWGGYAYTHKQIEGVAAPQEFSARLGALEAVVQNQDNREHDLLDSDDYYQFQGGMSNAVSHFSGQQPAIYHGDLSNPSQPKTRTLKEELNRVLRARVLNPKWIKAMREHGYKGAFEMAASVDYMFAYDATTKLIDDYQYQQVSEALIFDADNQAFLQAHNQAALEEMAERMLEACQRGMWQHPGDSQKQLQDLLIALDNQRERNS